MKAIIAYSLLLQFHFQVVAITYQWFTFSASFFLSISKELLWVFHFIRSSYTSIFTFFPNARGIVYQDSFTKPLSNVNFEPPSDGTWLVSQEGTVMIWVVIRKNVIFSQFHILLLSLFYSILSPWHFTHINPKDFPLPEVHFCSFLSLSVYLHCLPVYLIGFVTIGYSYVFPLLLPSHPKVFF